MVQLLSWLVLVPLRPGVLLEPPALLPLGIGLGFVVVVLPPLAEPPVAGATAPGSLPVAPPTPARAPPVALVALPPAPVPLEPLPPRPVTPSTGSNCKKPYCK